MKPHRRVGVIALAAVLAMGPYLLMPGKADAQQPRTCTMDPVQQSICVYQAILADVAKTYTQRGGGGISSIVQNSTTTFTVQIAQEGRKDVLNYTVKIGADGKVEIVERKEGTRSY
ncbi:hypothetical protein [Reyranella sp. CPCC 100927]|uniref:hypothetical protein n=1 Tax=Reyranella sp. CPCC 100927 TaxID=2599616 RepID=UPI0011B72FAF|nr:hypothetical protein [Reyranella sp. CPCC 100927]TWS96133.1 hypothetical protein FQU96_39475 [Reyranella sp. CPCC 100927]